MSFSILILGPRHYLWGNTPHVWFYRPDPCSKGSVGFHVLFVHINFSWGG